MARISLFKIILPIIFILIGLQQAPAWAGDIVVLQSARLPAYNDALRGFRCTVERCVSARGPKSIQPHTITFHVLSEVESLSGLRQQIIRQRPDLLLVIGSSSLSLVKNMTDIPILYLMVPYPELLVKAQDNITGINLHISAEQQLDALGRTLPQVKTIGLLYDPDRTGMFVKEAENHAKKNNLALVALPVKKSDEVPARLAELINKVDCFWMLPDRTVLTPLTVDSIMLFSLENRIPVLTFSEKYLELGAVLSVSFDPYDMGEQAGELALKVLNNTRISTLPPACVRKVIVCTNDMAAKTLGIDLE